MGYNFLCAAWFFCFFVQRIYIVEEPLEKRNFLFNLKEFKPSRHHSQLFFFSETDMSESSLLIDIKNLLPPNLSPKNSDSITIIEPYDSNFKIPKNAANEKKKKQSFESKKTIQKKSEKQPSKVSLNFFFRCFQE